MIDEDLITPSRYDERLPYLLLEKPAKHKGQDKGGRWIIQLAHGVSQQPEDSHHKDIPRVVIHAVGPDGTE